MKRLLRYWHTIRLLRPVQIYGRIWFRVARATSDLRAPPALRLASMPLEPFAWRAPSMTGPKEFQFVGQKGTLDDAQDWHSPKHTRLWLYNAHYFDDLTAQGAETHAIWQLSLIARWIRENPPASNPGWEPYPSSLRIVNWIKWLIAGNATIDGMHQSLAIQTRYLRARLEHHLLGNHLIANAKALVFSGLFFDGPEADRWYATGMTLLRREFAEQILPDGGHFELSPMYHQIILADLLDLVNMHIVFARDVPPSWRKLAARMLEWSNVMTHPDGNISFFNDAAFDIAPTFAEVSNYARKLGITAPLLRTSPLTWLEASGYVRMEVGAAVVLADMAIVGPDYLPAHAHADTLSFEFSLNHRRIIVNGGTSEYGTGPERQRQRGTTNHSTLNIDGEDSSEVWGGFRVARRAHISSAQVGQAGGQLHASGIHDGYSRLLGQPLHKRRWYLAPELLRVTDEISGGGQHDIAIIFHLGPGISARVLTDAVIELCDTTTSKALGRLKSSAAGAMTIADGTWHPRFGASLPNLHIRISLSGLLPLSHDLELAWQEQ